MTDPMCRLRPDEVEAALDDPVSGRRALPAFDVHVHYLPPRYRSLVVAAGIDHPDGHRAGLPGWSAAAHVEHLDRLGIQTSVVSISTPGVRLGDGHEVARVANEGGAELVGEHPGRFGFLAALPVPDVDAALAEIEYAFDELGAWGVSLLSNVAGVYLGDARLEPVFAELSRRNAAVLLHPTGPSRAVPGVLDGWPRPMYEYFFDSTRAVINLIMSGTLARNPGVRLIVPHAGAALPALAQRIARNVWTVNAGLAADREPIPEFVASLRRCYFDLAGSVVPFQLPSLRALVGVDRMLYGSDYPFTHAELSAELNADLRTTDLFTEPERRAVLRDNATGLFPELGL
ncbi:amidohydrolase family protein [Pseudonocardia acaciae]|uniref:amidohydrolase family protein n=1 Tax=Pseudonocardia acaciae TaxID=551276 RepID=UPI001B8077D7|nr:amidohydrolase family protein [Pseudonocardia acaciae]